MAETALTQELFPSGLPYNLEAEQSVLGAILVDASCMSTALEYLKPDSFYRPVHQQIFSAMLTMFSSFQSIDFITVLERVKQDKVFPTEEDAKIYLTQLVAVVPSTQNLVSYAQIVQEKYYLRSLIDTCQKVVIMAKEGEGDARTLLDMAEQEIFEIRQGRQKGGLVPIEEVILETYDQLQKLSGDDSSAYIGLPSGFSALDNILTGLNKSDLILLAARPGMGKTSFALNIASNVALKAQKSVAVFSLEMGKEQLVSRMLSSEALIPSQALRTGKLQPDDWVKLAMTAQVLSKAPIYIDDSPGITPAEIKAKLRRVKDLGLVVIDYLQLMSTGKRNDNRVQEVSELTRALKIMAKELEVPIITLSQLSRGPDARSDHRPMLSDLRDSGSIEQDADIVLFLYRDAYYNQESEEQNVAECIVAKNRHGETDSIRIGWDGQFTRFKGLEMFRSEG